jgi:hypothetical protein
MRPRLIFQRLHRYVYVLERVLLLLDSSRQADIVIQGGSHPHEQ